MGWDGMGWDGMRRDGLMWGGRGFISRTYGCRLGWVGRDRKSDGMINHVLLGVGGSVTLL